MSRECPNPKSGGGGGGERPGCGTGELTVSGFSQVAAVAEEEEESAANVARWDISPANVLREVATIAHGA